MPLCMSCHVLQDGCQCEFKVMVSSGVVTVFAGTQHTTDGFEGDAR